MKRLDSFLVRMEKVWQVLYLQFIQIFYIFFKFLGWVLYWELNIVVLNFSLSLKFSVLMNIDILCLKYG